MHVSKAAEIAERHGASVETGMDVLMMLIVAAQAWGTTAPEIRNPEGDDEPARRGRHREAMVRAVEAVVGSLLAGSAGRPGPGQAGSTTPESSTQ